MTRRSLPLEWVRLLKPACQTRAKTNAATWTAATWTEAAQRGVVSRIFYYLHGTPFQIYCRRPLPPPPPTPRRSQARGHPVGVSQSGPKGAANWRRESDSGSASAAQAWALELQNCERVAPATQLRAACGGDGRCMFLSALNAGSLSSGPSRGRLGGRGSPGAPMTKN